MAFAESHLEAQAWVAAFREELQKLGWTEGRNIRIDSAGRRVTRKRCDESRRNWSRCNQNSFFRHNTPTTATLLQQTTHHPDRVRVRFQIRSAAASSRAFRGRAATSPVSSISSQPWPASGWSCSRRSRRASLGSPFLFNPGTAPYAESYLNSVQSRRCLLRNGGDSRTCSRHVGDSNPSLPHWHATRMAASS